ncbi:IPT/TIG domain-containing protein, partial [bacterium]
MLSGFIKRSISKFLKLFLIVLGICILTTNAFTAIENLVVNDIEPDTLPQGAQEVDVKINVSFIDEPCTQPYYQPTFVIAGCQVTDVQFVNQKLIEGKVSVPRELTPGIKTLTVWGDEENTSNVPAPGGTSHISIDSATGTFTITSKPIITSIVPAETYKGSSLSTTTIYGNYFFETGSSDSFSIIGAGVAQTEDAKIITTDGGTYADIVDLSFSGLVTPGGPYKLFFVCGDGGSGYSTGADGKEIGLFTIYPAAAITSIAPASLYQGQTGAQVRLTATGLHSSSQVKITTASVSALTHTGGVYIKSTQVNAPAGEITVTLDIDESETIAETGNRYFWIINPDGQSSTNNISLALTATNFITEKYIPKMDVNNSTSSVVQGFTGQIILEADSSQTKYQFDDKTSPLVTVSGQNVTVNTVSIDDEHNTLTVYITVDPKAETGERTITVQNPTYNTQSTLTFNINESPYSQIDDADLLAGTTQTAFVFYQGETSTMTLSLTNHTTAQFEEGAEVSIGEGVTVKNTVRISSQTLWALVVVDPLAAPGDRNVTVTNPSYGVSKSTLVPVELSQYKTFTIDTVTPDSLYQGDVSTVTVTCTNGKFEDKVTAAAGGIGITLNSVVKISSQTLWLHLTVSPAADAGEHMININNPTYERSSAGSLYINKGPEPTGLSVQNPSSIEQGYNGLIEVHGFPRSFETQQTPQVVFSGSGIQVTNVNVVEKDVMTIYNQEITGSGITNAQVIVDSDTLSLVVTGGNTAGTIDFDLTDSNYDTIEELADAIDTKDDIEDAFQVKGPAGANISTFQVTSDRIIIYDDLLAGTTERLYAESTTLGDLKSWLENLADPWAVQYGDNYGNNYSTGLVRTNGSVNISTSSYTNFTWADTGVGNGWIISYSSTYGGWNSQKLIEHTYSCYGLDNAQGIRAEDTELGSLQAYIDVEPTAALGARTLTVTNPTFGTQGSCLVEITTSSFSTPSLNSVSVTELYQGDTYNIEVLGRGFAPKLEFSISGTGVKLNSFVRFSSTRAVLSVTVEPDASAENPYSLTINNTNYESIDTFQDAFTVREKHQVLNIEPTVLAPLVTAYFYINGTGFDNASKFNILIDDVLVSSQTSSGKDTIVFISSHCVSKNQISSRVYIEQDVQPGVHDLSVWFESNNATVTKRGILTIPKQPVISSIPTTISQGDVNKEVTIQGLNFEQKATVVISGSGIIITSTTVISDTIMTFRCDVSKEAEKTERQVRVINASGQFSNEIELKVIAPPRITICTPSVVLKGTTRYLEIEGENFNENFELSFSGETQYGLANYSESAITLLPLDDGTTVGYAGSKQLFVFVSIGSTVVSGLHDIEVINYDDNDPTIEESRGLGAGLLNVRTPLRIDSAEGEFKVPAGAEKKVIRIAGDGFSPTSVVSINDGDVEIVRQDFIGSRDIEVMINISPSSRLGRKTIFIEEEDGSSVYKQILEIIKPVVITEIAPVKVGVGLYHATMTITGDGIDIDTTTLTTRTFGPVGNTYQIQGIDPTGQVEILGGSIGNIVIDSTTVTSTGFRMYFTVFSTAVAGPRGITVINKDKENTALNETAFTVEETVEIEMFTPGFLQVGQASPFSIRGSGFDTSNVYNTDGSTITFSGGHLACTWTSPDSNYYHLVGSFTWTGAQDFIDSSVDLTVVNRDGTRGTYESALVLLKPLTIQEDLLYPTTIPINAEHVTVHVIGEGLMPGVTAYFWKDVGGQKNLNDVITKEIEYISDSEIKMIVKTISDINSGAQYFLTVENPNGASTDTAGAVLVVDDRPAVNSVVPKFIRIGGSKDVTINGFNFTKRTITEDDIQFAKGINFSLDGSIYNTYITGTIQVPESTPEGFVNIEITTSDPDKVGIGEALLEVLPKPRIDDIIPSQLYAQKTVQLFVNGEGFDEDVNIIIEEFETGATTYVDLRKGDEMRKSETRLQIEELTIQKQGDYNIRIENLDGSYVEEKRAIVVYPPVDQAQVFDVNPPYASQGDKEKVVTISGANFLPGMNIYVEGTGVTVSSSTVFVSSATIILNVSQDANPGPRNLMFANPNAIVSSKGFYITIAPNITSVIPGALQRGSKGELRIIGTNFLEDGGNAGGRVSVDISGDGITVYDSSTTFVSSTQLNTYIQTENNASIGLRDIIVTNPFGVKGTGAGLLKLVAPLTVDKIEPPKVSRGDERRTLLITGAGFEDGAQAVFTGSGITVHATTFLSDFSLNVELSVANNAELGTRGIKITNPNGTTVSVGGLLNIGPEVLVSLANPSKIGRGVVGITGDGVPIEIIGSNFNSTDNSISISGSGIDIRNVVTNGENSITIYLVVSDNAELGDRDITATTNEGSMGVGAGILEIIDEVTVRSINPSVITMHKEAFMIYNSSTPLTDARMKIENNQITLYHVDNFEVEHDIASFSTYPTIQSLVDHFNSDSVGNGWYAELASPGSADKKSIYLADISKVSVFGFTNRRITDFAYNEQRITIQGEGFEVGANTPTVSISGMGISIREESIIVTSSLSMGTTLVIDPHVSLPGLRDITVRNSDGALGTGAGIFTLSEPIAVSTAVPSIVGRGATDSIVRITGQGFASGIRADVDNPASGAEVVGDIDFIGSQEIKIRVKIPASYSGFKSTFTLTNVNGDSAKLYLGIDDLPIVASAYPSYLAQGAGGTASTATVTIQGNNLSTVVASTQVVVSGNGVLVISVQDVTNTSMTLGIRAARNSETGNRTIYMTDENGKQGTSEDIIEIVPAPTFTEISPTSILPGTTVTIDARGTGMEYGSTLSFGRNDILVSEYNYFNTERIIAKVFASSTSIPGTYDISIINPDLSEGTQFGVFTVLEPPRTPEITEVVPGRVAFGTSNQDILINGFNFEPGALVTFSETEISVSSSSYINSGQIRLVISVAEGENAVSGPRQVRVTNPSGKSSAKEALELIALPKIISMEPEALIQGTTALVYINGSGFLDGAQVSITGSSGINIGTVYVAGSTQLQFEAYASIGSLPGKHDISVITENGTGIGNGVFKVLAPLRITSVSPATLAQGEQGKDLWITGTGFDEHVSIEIGGGIEIKETKYLNDTSVRIVINISETAVLGARKISAYNANGAAYSVTDLFSIVPPVTVTDVDPIEVGIGVNDKRIIINGSQFQDGAQVSVTGLGVTTSSITYNSDSQLTAYISVSQTAEIGYRDIIVTNPDTNTGTGEHLLLIQEQVSINMVDPNYITLTANTTYQDITVRGTGFDIRTQTQSPDIEFSGTGLSVDPASVNVLSSDEVEATLWIDTTTATGGDVSDVRVTNPDGTTGIGRRLFIVTDPVTVSRVVPNSLGAGSKDQTISIIGNGFMEGADVNFTDTKISEGTVIYVSPQQVDMDVSIDITANIGYATFSVTNLGGESTTTYNTFSVTDAPVVYTVEPESYAQGAVNQEIVITGIGFEIGNTVVSIGGGVHILQTEVQGGGEEIRLRVNIDKVAAIGKRDINVLSDNKFGVGRELFEVAAAPAIFALHPAQVIQGLNNQYIEIAGQGFVPGSVFTFDIPGVSTQAITYIGAEKIMALINVSEGDSTPGLYDIYVENPDGSNGIGVGVLEITQPPIPPMMYDISPSRLNQGVNEQGIVITGSNLKPGINIAISGGGITISTVTYINDGQIIAVLSIQEDAVIGQRDITFTNSDGGARTYEKRFEVTAVPQITEVIPSAIDRASGVTRKFSVYGTGFLEDAEVEVSGYGVHISSVEYLGSTELVVYTVIYDTAPIGARDVRVINPYGIMGLGAGKLNVVAPAGIESVSPARIARGDQNRAVTIKGSSFQEGLDVRFGGGGITVGAVNYYSETQVGADLSIANDAEEGFRSVTIENPNGITAQKTNALEIGPPVEVSNLNPPTVGRGAENKSIIISGNNFSADGNTVEIDGSGITITTVTTTGTRSITMKINVGDNTALGYRDVIVTDANGSKGIGVDVLSIVDEVEVSHITPEYIEKSTTTLEELSHDHTNIFYLYLKDSTNGSASVTIYDSSMTLSVIGGENAGDFTFDFKGEYKNISLEELDALIKGLSGVPGAGENGWNVEWIGSLINTYSDYSPLLLGTAAYSATHGATQKATIAIDHNYIYGKKVVITGTGFDTDGGVSVELSGTGITASTVTVKSSIEVEADLIIETDVVGRGAHDVLVRNPDGTLGQAFGVLKVVESLYISTCVPSIIGNTQGTGTELVKVKGEGFIDGVTVSPDGGVTGIDISDVTYIDSTEISFKAKASTLGQKTLVIQNVTGGSSNIIITVQDKPVITSVSPLSLPQGAGGTVNYATITLTGVGFDIDASSPAYTSLKFHDDHIYVVSITSQTDTIIAGVRIDKGAQTGNKDIEIINKDGKTGTTFNIFRVDPAPTLTSIDPATLRPGTTTTMDIRGTGFTSTSRLEFGSAAVSTTSFNFANTERIVVRVSVNEATTIPGVYNVSVVNADHSRATAYDILTILDIPLQPRIFEISPKICSQGQSGQAVIISGDNFEQGAIVNFSGGGIVISSTTVLSGTEIRVWIDIAEDAALAYRSITITNPSGKASELFGDDDDEEGFQITALPEVAGMTPASVIQGTTNYIYINGTGFEENTRVEISGSSDISITTTSFLGSTQIAIEVIVGADALVGNHDIVVWTSNGSGIGRGVFKVVSPVRLDTINPSSLAQGQADRTVSIRGDGFDSGAQITFSGGGIGVSEVTLLSVNELTCKLTIAGDADTNYRDVTVLNANGSKYTKETAFKVSEPVVITSVEPDVLGIGVTDKTIIINGTGFSIENSSTPTVRVNGVGVSISSVVYNSASQLVGRVTVSPTAPSGDRTVIVTNGDDNEGQGADLLEIKSLITVGSIEPAYKALDALTEFDVVLRGEGFDTSGSTPTVIISGTGVSVKSSSAPTSANEMHLTFEVDTNAASIGSRDITLTNTDGSLGIGRSIFTITEPLAVDQAVPSDLGRGAEDTVITIRGQGFVKGADVTFADSNINVDEISFISSEQLEVQLDLNNVSVALGYSTFTITNPNKDQISSTDTFRVTLSPVVNSITDETKEYAQGAAAQQVIIAGANFTVNNTTVTFEGGGITVKSISVDASSSVITAVIDISENAVTGARSVMVLSDGNFGIGRELFTVLKAPLISSILPTSLVQGVNRQVIEINGSGFGTGGGASVTFDTVGITTHSVTLLSETKMQTIISVSSITSISGTYDIIIENADGSTGAGVNIFTIYPSPPKPIIHSVSPDRLSQGQGLRIDDGSSGDVDGQEIVIIGENFDQGSIAAFSGGGILITSSITYVSNGQIRFRVKVDKDAVVGYRDVTVTNPNNGIYTKEGALEIISTPGITKVEPASIDKAATAKVVPQLFIYGTGFAEGAAVTVSGYGVDVNTVTYIGSTQLQVSMIVYSTATVGLHDITVHNPYGVSGIGAGLLSIVDLMSIDDSELRKIPQGVNNRIISVRGNGFKEGAVVLFSGGGIQPANIDWLSEKELAVTVNVSADAALGQRVVTVTNPDGTNATSEKAVIEIVLPISISSVEPSQIGRGLNSSTLVIKGNGFEDGATVELSGIGIIISTYTTLLSLNEIHVDIINVSIDATLGNRSVIVTNPSTGEKGTAEGVLEVIDKVLIDSIEPLYLVLDTSDTVRIKGKGFELISGSTPTISISGGGVDITSVTYSGSTELKAHFKVLSSAAIGARDIRVTNADGTSGQGIGVFSAVVPLDVGSAVPQTLGKGTIGEIVEIRGQGFVKGASVRFGNGDVIVVTNVDYISSERLNAALNISTQAASQAYTVRVTNPDGLYNEETGIFTVDESPVVTNITPSSLAQGAIGQRIVLEGFNIESSTETTIVFSDSGILTSTPTIYISSAVIYATVEKGAETGYKNIIITNPDGTFGIARNIFQILSAPSVVRTDPNVVDQGSDNKTINVYGTGFKHGINASFDSEDLIITETTYISADRIILKLDARHAEIRSYDITVTNLDGSTGIGKNVFSVIKPPSVTQCSPSRLSQGTVDQEIAVGGTDFEQGAVVSFNGGGIHISTVNVNSPTQIIIKVSIDNSAETGRRTITVTNPNNSSTGDSGTGLFEVTPRPVITSVQPATLPQGSTSWLTIIGTGFYEGTLPDVVIPTVSFSGTGVAVSSVAYLGSTQIKVYIEIDNNAVTGTRDVYIVNADQTLGTGTGVFTVIAPIEVISINPAGLPQGANLKTVSIQGKGFMEGAEVKFSGGSGGGITVSEISFLSDTELSVVVSVTDDAVIESKDVTVRNPNGTEFKASGIFSIIEPIVVSSVDPVNIG